MPLALSAGALEVFEALGFGIIALILSAFLVPPLVGLLRQIPIVGGDLARAVQGFVGDTQKNAGQWLNDNISPLVQIVFAPVNAFETWLEQLVGLGDDVVNALRTLALSAGGAAGTLVDTVMGLVSQAAAFVVQIAGLGVAIDNVVRLLNTAVGAIVPGLIATAIAQLRGLLTGAIGVETALRAAAIVALADTVHQLIATAEAAAAAGDDALAHALSHTAASLSAAIVAAEAGAIDYVDGVAHTLGIEITDLRTVAIPAAIGIALTAVETVATTVTTLERECIAPTCAARSAGLDLFALLQAGVELLLLVTLLNSVIRDPERTAHDLAAGVDDLMGLASDVLVAFGVRL